MRLGSGQARQLRFAPRLVPAYNRRISKSLAESPMVSIEAVTRLHQECIARWHEQPIDNSHDGLLAIVCEQLSYNFRLWHEEDRARSPTASDTEIATVKRAIDKLNQQRND